MGVTVPVGTVFKFPIFLATCQFLSNAVGAAISWKVLQWKSGAGGSLCAEMRKCLGAGSLVTAQLTITKAASSIGAKTGLMGMPLSMYAVARSLGIPFTQLMRILVPGASFSSKMLLSTVLVFAGVVMSF